MSASNSGGASRRAAIVTGASRGIGSAIAIRMAAEGIDVAVIGRPAHARSTALEGSLHETAERARSMQGGRVHVIEADIGAPQTDRGAIVAEVADASAARRHPRPFGSGGSRVRGR